LGFCAPIRRRDNATDEPMGFGWEFERHTERCLAFDTDQYVFGLIPNESSQRNGGRELSGYEKAFFPVHRIQNWMIKHCTMRHQKKHVLSTLRCGTAMKGVAKDHIDS
jgi:hypothetical protein